MSPKLGFEFNPAQLKPQRTSISGSCGFPLLLCSGVMSNQPAMPSPDLGGSENKRSESQGYDPATGPPLPQSTAIALLFPRKGNMNRRSLEYNVRKDYMHDLTVGTLIRAAFTKG